MQPLGEPQTQKGSPGANLALGMDRLWEGREQACAASGQWGEGAVVDCAGLGEANGPDLGDHDRQMGRRQTQESIQEARMPHAHGEMLGALPHSATWSTPEPRENPL